MYSKEIVIVFMLISITVIALLVSIAITLISLYRKKQLEHIRNYEAINMNYEKNKLKTQLDIQEETFKIISREIHDNIGLSLTLAKLYLNALQLENKGNKSSIDSSIDLITKAIYDLSDISKGLNSEAILSKGFLNALQIEIDKIKRLGKHKVRFEIIGEPNFLDSNKELVLYRIVQEALNNVIKHARAKIIQLQLHYEEYDLQLIIKDDGIGIDWAELQKLKTSRIMSGLNNMQTRAQLIGGKFLIKCSQKTGTAVCISIPLK